MAKWKKFSVKVYLKYDGGGKSGDDFVYVDARNKTEAKRMVKRQAEIECWFSRHDGKPVFEAVELD